MALVVELDLDPKVFLAQAALSADAVVEDTAIAITTTATVATMKTARCTTHGLRPAAISQAT